MVNRPALYRRLRPRRALGARVQHRAERRNGDEYAPAQPYAGELPGASGLVGRTARNAEGGSGFLDGHSQRICHTACFGRNQLDTCRNSSYFDKACADWRTCGGTDRCQGRHAQSRPLAGGTQRRGSCRCPLIETDKRSVGLRERPRRSASSGPRPGPIQPQCVSLPGSLA